METVDLMPDGTFNPESEIVATKASAHLPGLDIDIIHRQSPNDDWAQVSNNLRATPSYETFGPFLEIADPFTIWAQVARSMWIPLLLAAQTLTLPDARPRILPSTARPEREGPTRSG